MTSARIGHGLVGPGLMTVQESASVVVVLPLIYFHVVNGIHVWGFSMHAEHFAYVPFQALSGLDLGSWSARKLGFRELVARRSMG